MVSVGYCVQVTFAAELLEPEAALLLEEALLPAAALLPALEALPELLLAALALLGGTLSFDTKVTPADPAWTGDAEIGDDALGRGLDDAVAVALAAFADVAVLVGAGIAVFTVCEAAAAAGAGIGEPLLADILDRVGLGFDCRRQAAQGSQREGKCKKILHGFILSWVASGAGLHLNKRLRPPL